MDDRVAWHWWRMEIAWHRSSVTNGAVGSGGGYMMGIIHQVVLPHLVGSYIGCMKAGFCDPSTHSIYSIAKMLGVAQGPHLRLVIG